MPNAHQWLVNPQAIEVWAHTAPALCSEPKCYLAAKRPAVRMKASLPTRKGRKRSP